jgi:hypothetical protein
MTTEQRDESVADAITIRDAWAHHVLPLRTEGSAMICATTEQHLPEAMAYAYTKLDRYAQFVLTEEHQLEHFIMQLFAKAGEKTESTETPKTVSNEA